ncbi:hypothetical protein Pmar_PMAR027631 [Perkinsus marinus ATCC 50983]|uniref:Uncharacterized protein n=1 Tax=Perkinsus marinus (strain ATCC 50983 / TXsc) TaxID=423536 RepID=C5KCA2_PERM5|nr:hypothetical protein Pmar_PMAR027631 [Perkinsus marinus ATCC 50983]EER17915.1 hypothetical protein Pmar_PMAR027631 [Perkinsus marinus ATCC 50983]|eukprot:XP_002786119.1 hypothetical protein Pmar_PMAR027631 [Perkinsus marinus ATCC 50983]
MDMKHAKGGNNVHNDTIKESFSSNGPVVDAHSNSTECGTRDEGTSNGFVRQDKVTKRFEAELKGSFRKTWQGAGGALELRREARYSEVEL